MIAQAPVFFACALLSAPVSTLVHELGHALAARLAGLHVTKVVVGGGAAWLRLRLLGLHLEFGRALLAGGGTTHVEPGTHRSRRRTAAMLLGGPLANLALGLAVAASASTTAQPVLLAAGFGVVASQVAFAFDALWPRPARIGATTLPSDGQALLALLAGPAK
ncbi:M50 family metallopeptidase [Caulobacter sp. 17J80-11]|uniref:M50 family metallopeptidase n=1 Tax=Caulobacter sp. 17J80-11 TaxID=2763502 RepID=UPI00165348B6|nr:M50 family metallopeptidase [Caulobacter sp. 17J80-11]MBC6982580.1 M50 family metallopeptidase [Caulobacter sp. 17J80-11]